MKFVVLVAAIALLEYVYFGYQVGRARAKYGVDPPAVTGDPIFERYHLWGGRSMPDSTYRIHRGEVSA